MKAEIPYFSKIEKGGQKGGQGRSYFAVKHASKVENLKKLLKIQSKIAHSQAPLLAPLLYFRKVWNLTFHWKKINIVATLDKFLGNFEIWEEMPIFQNFQMV